MKQVNITKRDVIFMGGAAVVGAGLGLAASKLTAKKELCPCGGDCCTVLDDEAATIEDDAE